MDNSSLARVFYPVGETITDIKAFLHVHRRIPFFGGIDEKLIVEVCLMLAQMDYRESGKPITLLIHSKGGACEHAGYLQNIIDSLNSPVDALVIGEATSMAVDVVQMCRKRLALPASTFLCHFVRHTRTIIFDSEDIAENEVLRQEGIETKRRREELYSRRTGKTVLEIEHLFRNGEVYKSDLSAHRALEFGLIDEIITDFKLFPDRSKAT